MNNYLILIPLITMAFIMYLALTPPDREGESTHVVESTTQADVPISTQTPADDIPQPITQPDGSLEATTDVPEEH